MKYRTISICKYITCINNYIYLISKNKISHLGRHPQLKVTSCYLMKGNAVHGIVHIAWCIGTYTMSGPDSTPTWMLQSYLYEARDRRAPTFRERSSGLTFESESRIATLVRLAVGTLKNSDLSKCVKKKSSCLKLRSTKLF